MRASFALAPRRAEALPFLCLQTALQRRQCAARAQSEPTLATSAADASPPHDLRLEAMMASSIDDIGAAEWDACHDGTNPFLSFAFLQALEESGSVAAPRGWLPRHFCIRGTPAPGAEGNQLLAVVPLYLKGHSYGEYVFDSAWAEAYERHFLPASGGGKKDSAGYYPKLQSCVPFTPVTGQRLLVRPGPNADRVAGGAAATLASLPAEMDLSSLHVTFGTEDEWALLARAGGLRRVGVQYHWHNNAGPKHGGGGGGSSIGFDSVDPNAPMYTDFDEFLGALQQRRRKSVRQEQKRVAAAGLSVGRLSGSEVQDPALWDAFYEFYLNTIDRKWGTAYLTRDFFEILSERMSDQILLVTATDAAASMALPAIAGAAGRGGRRSRPVAAALNLLGTDAIYGRNWGAAPGAAIKGLHFELCFYQAIEHAIEHGFKRVEAGAQGEHKLARGYLPQLTYSNHFLPDPEFRGAVDAFLRQERAQIEYYAVEATEQESPYKRGDAI
jgi:predicted N-acyltransferase